MFTHNNTFAASFPVNAVELELGDETAAIVAQLDMLREGADVPLKGKITLDDGRRVTVVGPKGIKSCTLRPVRGAAFESAVALQRWITAQKHAVAEELRRADTEGDFPLFL